MRHYLAHLVEARFLLAKAEGEDDSGKKSGPPARWAEWLKEVQQGGKKRVKNPNPQTSKAHPDVSFSTALKDKGFYRDALKDYYKWLKQDEKGSKKSEPAKEEKPAAKKSESPLDVSDEHLDGIIKDHAKDFDEITKKMKGAVKGYRAKMSKPRTAMDKARADKWKKMFDSLEPEAQELMAAGALIGEHFQTSYAKKNAAAHEAGKDSVTGWQVAGNMSKSEDVQNLLGVVESWGVKGARLPDEQEESEKQRKAGAGNKDLQAYGKEVYDFTQAYFKHRGIKELNLYRGVKGQGVDDAKAGDEADLETRAASSFSLSPSLAGAFGKVLAFKVPVKDILLSSLTYPGLEKEAEMIVLGSPRKGKFQ
jgi:hypothetical protein